MSDLIQITENIRIGVGYGTRVDGQLFEGAEIVEGVAAQRWDVCTFERQLLEILECSSAATFAGWFESDTTATEKHGFQFG